MEIKKEHYSQIIRVWSSDLGEYIVFNQVGYHHLIRKNGKQRSRADQARRFALLDYAVNIIENPDAGLVESTMQADEIAHRHGNKIRMKGSARFWSSRGRRNGKLINVIVRQIGEKTKHFFSIYDKKERNKKTIK